MLERRHRCLDRVVDQSRRALGDIGPQVDVDHNGAMRFKRWDQILAHERGLADAADARQEDT